jgi:tetratricopeptide (TPR) repeat protein
VTMRELGDSVVGWAICLGSLWLSILSKQEAIVAFAFVFLFEVVLARARLSDPKPWIRTGLVAIPTAAYFVLRAVWITKQNPGDDLRYASGFEYPFTMMKAHLFYYARNYLWPFEMRALASFPLVGSLADARVLLGLVTILSTLGLAWWCRNRVPLASLAIVSYWLFFALTSSIFPFRFVVTDYRQYVPLVFLSLVTVLVVSMLLDRNVAIAVLVVFIAYSAASSFYINTHWKTEESFWHQSVEYGARALAHNNYGLAVSGRDPDLAEFHYLEALRQEPFNMYPNINLGMLYVRDGRQDEGLALLRATAARNSASPVAAYWLSKGLGVAGLKQEQLDAAIRAAELDAGLLYQYEAGSLLHFAGDTTGSIPYLERVVAKSAGYEQALFMLAFAHSKLGDTELAIAEYERYLRIHPEHVQSHFNLGYELSSRAECPAAIEHFDTVLALQPEYAAAHFQLAKCYRALGDEAAAREQDALYEAGS